MPLMFGSIMLSACMLTGCTAATTYERPTARTDALAYATEVVREPEARSATPFERANAPAASYEAFTPSSDQEQAIGGYVDRAYFMLLENEVRSALEVLEEAQTVPYWSQSVYAPDVLFWTGHAYDRLGERSAAIVHYRRVVQRYDGTPVADRATQRLRELRDGETQPPVTTGDRGTSVTASSPTEGGETNDEGATATGSSGADQPSQ
ncbi:MAG: tetratricopeptide repeat protein [Planctomycetota bacterium]